MARFESDSRVWAVAATEVERRVAALPAYAEARATALRLAAAEVADATADATPEAAVAAMRALGGWSAVVERAVRKACAGTAGALDPSGSALVPLTVEGLLLRRAGELRVAAQSAAAAARVAR